MTTIEYKYENQPEYRKKAFDADERIFKLAKKYNDKLFALLGDNPNEVGLSIKKVIQKNYERRKQGLAPLAYTLRQKKFIKNAVSFEEYYKITSEMVNDPDYQKYSKAIEIQEMDQVNDPEGWMSARLGDLEGYEKAAVASPSGVHSLVYPKEAEFEGQSLIYYKRKKQGLPIEGDDYVFNPLIAERGHTAEPFIRNYVPQIFDKKYGVTLEVFPEPERLLEHCVFGDFLHGNTDGTAFNLDTNKFEGIEIKTTSAMLNMKKVLEYKDGIVPGGYLSQMACYMSILNYDTFNLTVGWGLGWSDDMTGIRVERSLEDEAYLLARIIWFMIEKVLKDQDIDEDEHLANPKILLKDLYTIYGKSEPGKTVYKNDKESLDIAKNYLNTLDKIKAQKANNKRILDALEDELAEHESKLLETAEDAEKIIMEDLETDENYIIYLKTKTTKRFSSKKYDALLKALKKGEISEEEFDKLAKDRRNFENESTSRSVKYWNK